MTQVTTEQVQLLRRLAAAGAPRTRRGRRWLELLRTHEQELLHHYTASPTLREHTDQALAEAAALVESLNTDRPRVVDDDVIAAVEAVLAELDPRASTSLHQAIDDVRWDLGAARGKTIREILGPRET